jgi:quinol monooxygenase YgiN
MGFLQIIDFHTDRLEEFTAAEAEWSAATEGARTFTGGQLFADRDTPGHYIALDWFTDYDSAMVNSALPATSAFAEKAMALSRGPVAFHNLEPVVDAEIQGADDLRAALETSTLKRHAFTDDVELDMIVPHGRVKIGGADALESVLGEETSARRFEVWETHATATGFAVEYVYRTLDEADLVSAGSMIVRVHEGRIARLFVTCGGSWDAATQRQVREQTGELGDRLVGSSS